MSALNGRRVLIVEDDFLVAYDLAQHLETSGATVLGPAPTISRGTRFVSLAEAAVLDIDLGGELVFPLADRLRENGVPFVFYTGCDVEELPFRFRSVSLLRKPEQTVELLARHFGAAEPAQEADVEALLPKLRVIARTICFDPEAADRLVERTLERAIDAAELRDPQITTGQWLVELLNEVAENRNRSLMN